MTGCTIDTTERSQWILNFTLNSESNATSGQTNNHTAAIMNMNKSGAHDHEAVLFKEKEQKLCETVTRHSRIERSPADR